VGIWRAAVGARVSGTSVGPRGYGCRLAHSARSDRRDDRLDRLGPGKALPVCDRDVPDRRGAGERPATTSLLWYLGVSGVAGRTETPSPEATMLRTVSREVVRVTCASARFEPRDRRRAPVRGAVADAEQDRVLAGQLVRPDRLPPGPPVPLGHHDPDGSSYRNSVATPDGANGSAMIAASILPDFNAPSRWLGEIFLEIERHLRRPLAQRGNQVGQQNTARPCR